jgi:hypothetical protein
MSAERVKALINAGDLQTLYENDQVRMKIIKISFNLTSVVEYTNGGWPYFPALL